MLIKSCFILCNTKRIFRLLGVEILSVCLEGMVMNKQVEKPLGGSRKGMGESSRSSFGGFFSWVSDIREIRESVENIWGRYYGIFV